MKRRDLLKAACALPLSQLFRPLNALAQPARGATKITAIKALRIQNAQTLIRIDTDAGISGYGECGADGNTARAVIAAYNGGGRLPHLGLIGKDPLAIQVHFHNMFYAYEQRGRAMRVLSGIDMALWDLAGKLLQLPVSKLLGGNFRDEVEVYSHCPPGDYLSKAEWKDRAQLLKTTFNGIRTFKVDTHIVLGIPMQQYAPSLGPQDFRKMATAYAMAREALGDDIDIHVHCHCEYDVPSAIGIARAVEPIKPIYFEDPLQPGWSENWQALRRATTLPIMTGENMELAEWAVPFLENQAVNIFQPDIVNSGGITGARMIAELAARYRVPIALHNVSGLLLNMASQQLAAATFNCPRIEMAHRALDMTLGGRKPIQVRDGKMKVSALPGLGVEIDEKYLRANAAPGEPWWG
jgi:L-alanine-DL-glutamate epimerase-like enolase superfamily enzyme